MARSENDAAVIGISAAVVYDVISATNSSPQTTEINAQFRVATLMKWVKLGIAQAALFVLLMTIAEPKGKKWRPITGGGIAMVLLWAQYVHAANAGISHPGTPTEQYIPGSYGVGANPSWPSNAPPQPVQTPVTTATDPTGTNVDTGGQGADIQNPIARFTKPKYRTHQYATRRRKQTINLTN